MVEELPVPVLISGGLRSAAKVQEVFERTGAEAVLLARGSLGNPWIFEQVLGAREDEPTREEILIEIDWVLDRAVEHMGEARAARYLRKFYPWYVTRLGEGKALQDRLQRTQSTAEAREAFGIAQPVAA
jgi:tRNA-dihydrouridine synthase